MAKSKKNILQRFFYPKEEKLQALTYREREKLNSLITGDLICNSLFFVFGLVLVSIKSTFQIVGGLMMASMIFFGISLILIRLGKIYTGSYMATIGFLITTFIINFFTGYSDTGFIFFRGACFCVVMSNFNYIISIKPAQLVTFFLGSLAIFVATMLTIFRNIIERSVLVQLLTCFSCILGMFGANMILITADKQSNRIIKKSEDEHNNAELSLKKMTSVLSQTKESLNIGQELNTTADRASGSVQEINELYENLIQCSNELKTQTESIRQASSEVDTQAGLMNEAMQKQNASLAETSTAMTEISSNISQINIIAEKRREGLSNVAGILETQKTLVARLVEEVEKVKESSKEISKFVQTVDDIAGQTNLLAMNASIEAAHAGTMGKGFGVIAQEIRKLSVETSKNASKIAETLKDNTAIVQETSDSVNEFVASTNNSTEEISATVVSMEEIIHGIKEINQATSGITASVQNVVNLAEDTEGIVSAVSHKISDQGLSLESISSTSETLKDCVDSIKASLFEINGVIDEIHDKAKTNEEVSGKIASLLD
ncbi:MAG: hypothetical protein K5839_06830 [Treponemataceae bacterium]|nr:hypothetical protein [Treponemataceae bacterium]